MKIRMIGYCGTTDTYNVPISDWYEVNQEQIDLFTESNMQFEVNPDLEHYLGLASKAIEKKKAYKEKYADGAAARAKKAEVDKAKQAKALANRVVMLAKLKAELES
jgi:hypothetical protein